MLNRVLPFGLALAVAFALTAAALADKAADKPAKANTHSGKLVSVTGNKLTMTGKGGKEHTHTLADGAVITCDGKKCKTADLKPGVRIRVTTKAGDPTTAVKVEAFTKTAKDTGRIKK